MKIAIPKIPAAMLPAPRRWSVGACRWQLGQHLWIILLFAALRVAAATECGNGLQEEGEACEDGNNVRCLLPVSTPLPISTS